MKLSLPFELPGRSVAIRNQTSGGFSLIELITVIAIMAAMVGLVVPSVTGILNGKSITRGVDTVSGMLEMSRSEAIAKKTYVWVGISGSGSQMQIAAVRSLDATADLSVGNYAPVGKVQKIDNVMLVAQSNLGTPMQAKLTSVLANGTCVDIGAATPGSQSFSVGSQTFNNLIIFTSEGEVLTSPPATNTPFPKNILIGLRESRGGRVVAAEIDSSAILVGGGSGSQQVIRL